MEGVNEFPPILVDDAILSLFTIKPVSSLPQITLATLILELNFKTTKIRILSHDFKVLLFSFMCLVYFTFKDIIIKNLKNISKSRPPPSHPSPSPEFGKYRPSCKNRSYKQTGVFIGKPCMYMRYYLKFRP